MIRCGVVAGMLATSLSALDASAQAARVTGRVTDSLTSAPIVGATVSAIRPGGSSVVASEAVTDTSGQYAFDVAPGAYNLRATKASYRLEWFNDVKCQIVCTDPPQWTLSAGTTFTADFALDLLAGISGTVVDALTLAPLVATSDISYAVTVFDSGGQLTGIAETDASGHYAIAGLVPGTYFVGMRNPPGYVAELYNNIPCIAADCPPTVGTAVVLGVGTAATINFDLNPGGVITGTVRRASNGSGIQGLTVNVYKTTKTLVASAVTGPGGTYSVGGLATGSYFAVVGVGSSSSSPRDYLFEAYGGIVCPSIECQVTLGSPIAVTQGSTTAGIDFSLDQAGTISGTVLAADAPAPPGTFVSAIAGNVALATAVVAANGEYSIVGLSAGAYQIQATAPSPYVSQWFNNVCVGCPGTPTAVVVAAGATVTNINFSMSPGGAIAGNVSCEFRSPSDFNSGPQIYVFDSSGRQVRSTLGTLAFGTCSTYLIDRLPAGEYYLLARDTPSIPFGIRPFGGVFVDKLYGDVVCMTVDCDVRLGIPVIVTLGQTTQNIDFVMKQGTGSQLVSLNEELSIFDSRGVELVSVVRGSFFSFGQQAVGLPPGTYFARLGNRLHGRGLCLDCPPTSGQPIVVGPDLAPFSLDFGPPSTGRVSGTVRDSVGALPLSNIGVELYSTTGQLLASGTSDITGHYMIGGTTPDAVPPGTYFLRTRNRRGYVDEVFPDVICAGCDVRIGTAIELGTSEVSGIDFTLGAGGVVGGTVTDVAGVAVEGVPVSLFKSAGEFAGKAVSSSTGLYDVTLPAGSYRARAQASASHGAEVYSERPCTSADCDVIAGTPIAVTAGTLISNINFTLANCRAMTLSPPLLASGVVGRTYRQVFLTSGGAGPYVYEVTDGLLPPGVALGTSSGVLDGIPTLAARHAFTIGVVDANGCATTRAYTLDVQQCAFTLSPSSATVAAAGGTIRVAISDACGSQTVTGLSFVSVQSNTAGQVVLDVPVNTGAATRTDDITIGRRVFSVRQAGLASLPPFGALDAPLDGAQVSGSIAVGGWALDDLEVTRVLIFRDPVGGEPPAQIFIGTAVFVAGARRDVTQAYPTYPLNNRAGWGFLILTNMLPNQGNGTFRIYAYADDAEGARALLGAKTIVVNNTTSTLPFGAIDTPGQGETIAGSGYLNWGWALTPQPKIIPTDGSTIHVYVDGVPQGSPVYGLFRPDVSGLFPELANSGGPVGYRVLDTTALAEGQHTIAWVVADSQGAASGIGSRYFSVANSADAQALALMSAETKADAADAPAAELVATAPSIAVLAGPDSGRRAASLATAPVEEAPIVAERGRELARRIWADAQGKRSMTLRGLQRVELTLSDEVTSCAGTWAGYLVDDGTLGDLPVGAAIEPTGKFYWQPGPGFVGRFELLFVRTACDGTKERLPLTVTIRTP